jgi:hypothetical protein
MAQALLGMADTTALAEKHLPLDNPLSGLLPGFFTEVSAVLYRLHVWQRFRTFGRRCGHQIYHSVTTQCNLA